MKTPSVYRNILTKNDSSITDWFINAFPEIKFIWEAPEEQFCLDAGITAIRVSIPLPEWFDTIPRGYQTDMIVVALGNYFAGVRDMGDDNITIYLPGIKISKDTEPMMDAVLEVVVPSVEMTIFAKRIKPS